MHGGRGWGRSSARTAARDRVPSSCAAPARRPRGRDRRTRCACRRARRATAVGTGPWRPSGMRALPWRAILCDSSSWRLLPKGCGDRRPTMDGGRSRRSFFSPSVQQAPGHPPSSSGCPHGRTVSINTARYYTAMEDRPGMACAQPTAPILVVEDNADVRDAWEALLEGEGYRVVSAASGREALRWLRSSEVMPALILLDRIMPGMNGWDFRAEQSQDETLASIPVIVVSADPLATLAKNAGVAAVLGKPTQSDALLAAVRLHCEHTR